MTAAPGKGSLTGTTDRLGLQGLGVSILRGERILHEDAEHLGYVDSDTRMLRNQISTVAECRTHWVQRWCGWVSGGGTQQLQPLRTGV